MFLVSPFGVVRSGHELKPLHRKVKNAGIFILASDSDF